MKLKELFGWIFGLVSVIGWFILWILKIQKDIKSVMDANTKIVNENFRDIHKKLEKSEGSTRVIGFDMRNTNDDADEFTEEE